MTLSELAAPVVPESTLTAHGEWRKEESVVTKLPPCTPNNLSGRLESRSKMRLSMQMARLRAKLPPEERSQIMTKIPPPASSTYIKPVNKNTTAKEIPTPTKPVTPHTPPPPCNACDVNADRKLVLSLISVMNDDYDKQEQSSAIKHKSRKSPKFIRGWEFESIHQNSNEKLVDSRAICTANVSQRRCSTTSGGVSSDNKLKFNLYDRYTANSITGTFKFFHYSDLRLYIKQYRRNHSSGAGQRSYNGNASPVCELGFYRIEDNRLPSYYSAKKARDGFVLGLQSHAVTPNVWKANVNLPLPSAFRQRIARKNNPEEQITTPSVFVRQNGAFSQFWKTKEDGTPNPSIAVTRPPTNQQYQRPSCTEENKENLTKKSQSPTRDSPGTPNSLGDPKTETSTWQIMKMITSCSIHSRTDGSDLTTTNECTSPTLDTDSSPGQEKLPDTGEMTSNSMSPEEVDTTNAEESNEIESHRVKFQKTYDLLNNMQNERPIMYNRTRSILSNMSNLLSYYIDSEMRSHAKPGFQQQTQGMTGVEFEKQVSEGTNKPDELQRNQLVQLRKDLQSLAARRSPYQKTTSSTKETAKVGSLILSSNKDYDRNLPTRCSTSNRKTKTSPTREIRKSSPARFGHAGYRKLLLDMKQKEEDRPILFVSRSHLLPTVSASVEAMKSRQIMLHRRTTHPADTKQFTKITDLLKSRGCLPGESMERQINTASGRRTTSRSKSLPEGRVIQSFHMK